MLLESWYSFLKWFWNPAIWIPLGLDWKDVQSTDEVNYANFGDLIYPIPMALVLLCLRSLTERFFLYPLGQSFGLKNIKSRKSIKANPVLEKVYKKSKSLGDKELEILAKKTDMDVRHVERWMRRRLAANKPTILGKFSESGWRLMCYAGYLSLGLWVLWDKDWIWNMDNCWLGYPHELTSDIWWFYMLEMAFYWSLIISQFYDHKRKDFWQMFLHHLATIFLLGFSWTCNFTRIGVIVAVLHDAADPLLEFVKLCMYVEANAISNISFLVFMFLWISTRLGLYPACVLHSTIFQGHKLLSMIPAYYVFNVLLLTILCLNIFWTYFILKMALTAVGSGEVKKDARSSSEDEEPTPSDSKEGSPQSGMKIVPPIQSSF